MKKPWPVGNWDHGRSQLTHASGGKRSTFKGNPLTNVPQRIGTELTWLGTGTTDRTEVAWDHFEKDLALDHWTPT